MPKTSKTSNKKPKTKIKKVAPETKKASNVINKPIIVEKKNKVPVKISKTYVPKSTEKYMCDKHLFFF